MTDTKDRRSKKSKGKSENQKVSFIPVKSLPICNLYVGSDFMDSLSFRIQEPLFGFDFLRTPKLYRLSITTAAPERRRATFDFL